MSLGNISQETRKKDCAWRLLGYIPIIDDNALKLGKQASKELRSKLFQQSLKHMLRSVTDLTLE